MPSMIARASNRREFVRFLAGSPLLGWGGGSAVAQAPSARPPRPNALGAARLGDADRQPQGGNERF